jgi:nucleotide-binding universal stress UspA family protein
MTATAGAPIVVGLDGSPSSSLALDWAVQEASRRDLPLRLVTAIEWLPYVPGADQPTPEQRQAADAAIAQARERLSGRDFSVALPMGDPSAALVDESPQATMVVVGNRGRGGFRGLLAGSVSVQVAAHAAGPVVVVRPQPTESPAPERDQHGVGRIVVGTDCSTQSTAAVAFAFAEARLRGVDLTAVHAWEVPLSASDLLFNAYQRTDLEDLQHKLLADHLVDLEQRYPDVQVRRVLAQGNPTGVLVRESAGADLLVVGSRGHGGFTGLLLGSVSEAAIQHARCPVAVVRHTSDPKTREES